MTAVTVMVVEDAYRSYLEWLADKHSPDWRLDIPTYQMYCRMHPASLLEAAAVDHILNPGIHLEPVLVSVGVVPERHRTTQEQASLMNNGTNSSAKDSDLPDYPVEEAAVAHTPMLLADKQSAGLAAVTKVSAADDCRSGERACRYQDSWTPVSDTYLMMMVAASGAELIERATAEESYCSNNPLEPVSERVAAVMEEVVAEEEEEEAALRIPVDNSRQELANPTGTAVEMS